jgi:D-aminoacyl-tRNA deacylase
MRLVIQRVLEAGVRIDDVVKACIGKGLLVLVGFEEADNSHDLENTVKKLVNMRIFSDAEGKMNFSVKETGGEILIVSQFTLYADTRKGNRPSFMRAAKQNQAIPLYENFILLVEKELGSKVQTGVFGADMKVSLVNDGPLTITIDSR